MAIVASLPNHNPFSSLPRNSPSKRRSYQNPNRPPIPIPKYPPKVKPLKSQTSHKTPPKPPNQDQQNHPSFIKIPHNRTKYYKPISPHGERIVSDSDDPNRAVLIGDSGVSYLLPDAPFEFQFSYSEVPKSKPVAIREPAFLPFAPPSMPRPWTGKAALKSKREKEMKKNKIALFDSFNPPSSEMRGIKEMQMPRAYKLGEFQKERRSREEILGEPLSRAEIKALVQPLLSDNRQVNLGRDGLTHNMLDLINSHWKRQQVCKVKCKGVPTVDMDNVARCLEEKTGGKIIHRAGGVVYLFRGRYYNYHTRPQYPLMLWKPAAPVYPKLIQDAPEGLTKEEADKLRQKGKSLLAICKLAKNGVYVSLVNDVRHAFEGSALVKVDCRGLDASDYKKIGAKLKELVPCVLLSFDNEQILMWRGHDWKSMYPATTESKISHSSTGSDDNPCEPSPNKVSSSPRMMTLWNRAVESNKAFLLDIIDLTPDALLEKVEEFEGKVQATEHSYPALLVHGEDRITNFAVHDEEDFDDLSFSEEDDDLEDYVDDPFEAESSDQRGSLPVDLIAKKFLND